ncbi:hypothetical protein Hdeb2414_s0228g00840621 [Helianthus debilis subsp. tardiflorus]
MYFFILSLFFVWFVIGILYVRVCHMVQVLLSPQLGNFGVNGRVWGVASLDLSHNFGDKTSELLGHKCHHLLLRADP